MKAVIGLLSFSLIASAQPPDSLWSRTFGGPSPEYAYAMLVTADGGYLLAGSTWSYPNWTGIPKMWLLKTDANGDSLWSHTYGNGAEAYSVKATPDGGYALAGYIYSSGQPDMWLLKTDANGDSLWSRTYGGSGDDGALAVLVAADGGYVLAGTTGSFGAGRADMWLVKTDANGDSLWSKTFGGSSDDYGAAMLVTADGGYLLAGSTRSFGAGTPDFFNMWLVKADANGDSLWSRTFSSLGYGMAYSVQATADGGYVLAGTGESSGTGSSVMWLVKTDANGDSLWSRTYGNTSTWDIARSVQVTADGGYLLAGESTPFSMGTSDMWLVRTDANGDSLWSRTFGGGQSETAYAAQVTADGGYAVAGTTNSYPLGNYQMWLVKTGSDPANAARTAPALPFCYALTVFPNPFNPSTTLSFSLTHTGVAMLSLYDLTGRSVRTLVDQPMSAGEHQYRFDGSSLSSGVYFIHLQSSQASRTQKIILLK